MTDLAREVMRRIEALAKISEEPGRLTRTFCSPAMRAANDLVARWMRSAGMTAREDGVGNLLGSYPAKNGQAKTLMLGSHLDTVRDAGKFDGPLGVLLAIACVQQLRAEGELLPFGIDVVGFADEEGVRYQTTYLGSRAMVGELSRADLGRKDADGITMGEALRKWRGTSYQRIQESTTETISRARLDHRQLLGYLEAHIEQGPVLESKKLAVGVVSAIAGQGRYRLAFTGQAGHAGTTPMNMRRDALCAAAEFVSAVERFARENIGLIATVGQLRIQPNVSNVIPATVVVTLDVRHESNAKRTAASRNLCKRAMQIGKRRKIKVFVELVQETGSVPCSPKFQALLSRAVRKYQREALILPSGAGHDAAVLGRVMPAAMLFIRCKHGLSHHPDESASLADVRVALDVMTDFVRLLAEEVSKAKPETKFS